MAVTAGNDAAVSVSCERRTPTSTVPAWVAQPAWLVAVAYGAGFLVVNEYLARYAEVPGELVHSRYISAGILFIFVVGIPVGVSVVEWRMLCVRPNTPAPGVNKGTRWWLATWGWLLVMQAGFFGAWRSLVLGPIEVAPSWTVDAVSFFPLVLLGIAASSLADTHRQSWISRTLLVRQLSTAIPLFVYGAAALLLLVATFAIAWYPRLKPQYGGGAAPAATVYLRDDALATALGIDTLHAVAVMGQYDGYIHVVTCQGLHQRLQSTAIAVQDLSGIRYLASPLQSGNALVVISDDPCAQLGRVDFHRRVLDRERHAP